MTEAERLLWYYLRGNQTGFKFRKQHPFGKYIVDFICLEKKLIIELDGSQHGEAEHTAYDSRRDKFFKNSGYNILRFWDDEIFKEMGRVRDNIQLWLESPPTGSIAADSPSGGESFRFVASLHSLCFPHKPWSVDDFADLKKSGCEIIAGENGFIVWRAVGTEAEIITIGVRPDARKTGIADAMLAIAENEIKKSGAQKIFLEVAEDNIPARKLYEKHGYLKIGIRPKYYDGKDAIVMAKQI